MLNLIVGLGNPGKKYQNTRHNLGFLFVDFFQKYSPSTKILKPQNFMNNSGLSVSKEINFYKINLNNLLVVHDDLDLPLGEWRLQFDRSSAGHNGVKSIIEHLNSQSFWRLRLGIGRPQNSPILPEDYVLLPFKREEIDIISKLFVDILDSQEFKKLQGP